MLVLMPDTSIILNISFLLLMVHNSSPLIEKLFEIETCGPPQIQNTMLNQTKNPGDSVYFRCQIDMSKCMVAFIDWYHDKDDGSERKKVKSARVGDPHTHEIAQVQPNDQGTYTCVVGNVLGKAEASAYLQVKSGSRGQMRKGFSFLMFVNSIALLLRINLFSRNSLIDVAVT